MMGYLSSFFGGGFGCPYIHASVYLHGVRGNYFNARVSSGKKLLEQGGLAGGGRTEEDEYGGAY